MNISGKFLIFIASCAILATPSNAGALERKTKSHHRHYTQVARGCPVHKNAYGELIDCRGWRLWSGSIGWDNTCLNLDYLPGQFACSSRDRR